MKQHLQEFAGKKESNKVYLKYLKSNSLLHHCCESLPFQVQGDAPQYIILKNRAIFQEIKISNAI